MTVLGETVVAEFGKKYAASRKPLGRFLVIARAATWKHMADVKLTFAATDYDSKGQTYIFNIGGNKYRLFAAIDFEEQTLSIEAIMTHEQYSRK